MTLTNLQYWKYTSSVGNWVKQEQIMKVEWIGEEVVREKGENISWMVKSRPVFEEQISKQKSKQKIFPIETSQHWAQIQDHFDFFDS